jgi:predicted nucleic acid-binding protein
MVVKCLDTYALIEISEANPKFVDYFKDDVIILDVILAEFYSVLLRRFGKQTASYWIKKVSIFAKTVPFHIFIEAMDFRYEHHKKGISFFDAVGYIYCVKNDSVFVTGDKEFEHFKNVEFRK